jgi:hypothetical protein
MGEDQGQERTQLSDDPNRRAAELRSEIEDVREDLGDTAAELAAKTDVKARARAKVDDIKHTAQAKKDDLLSVSSASTSGGSDGSPGPSPAASAVNDFTTKAKQYPVPTAAVGAMIGGFLLGRLTRRRP